MNKVVKKTLAVATTAAAIAGLASVPTIVSAWGDSNGSNRPEYTVDQINQMAKDGTWAKDKIVFNSITNSVMGHEFNFVGARDASTPNNGYNGNDITVENGKEYYIRLYVHNNNPWDYEGVAKDTKVAFSIPSGSSKQVQVNGFISSSNANPGKYWDYVNFNADQAFHLEYVYGSALLENNGIGKNGGLKLSDEIVTKASTNGTLIGYDALDGNIPGCYQYSSYVTIKVKAVFDTDYLVENKVKVLGVSGGYHDYVDAKVGDKVQFQIQYQNLSKEGHPNVMIRSVLPKNLRYVPGTTKLYNGEYESGVWVVEDTIIGNGINIGNYLPQANAYIRFTAEVVDEDLACGSNTLVNWAQGWVGSAAIQDYASVILNKVCENTDPTTPVNPDPDKPNKLPNTGPEALAGGVIATGSIVTAAGYYIVSRRALR